VWARNRTEHGSNLQQTVATSLDAWQEPRIAAATAGDSRIGAGSLLDAPTARGTRTTRWAIVATNLTTTAAATLCATCTVQRDRERGRPRLPPSLS